MRNIVYVLNKIKSKTTIRWVQPRKKNTFYVYLQKPNKLIKPIMVMNKILRTIFKNMILLKIYRTKK